MTTQEFLNTYNLIYKIVKADGKTKHIALVINKRTNEMRPINFEYNDTDASDFILFTGQSLYETALDELAVTIKSMYNIIE